LVQGLGWRLVIGLVRIGGRLLLRVLGSILLIVWLSVLLRLGLSRLGLGVIGRRRLLLIIRLLRGLLGVGLLVGLLLVRLGLRGLRLRIVGGWGRDILLLIGLGLRVVRGRRWVVLLLLVVAGTCLGRLLGEEVELSEREQEDGEREGRKATPDGRCGFGGVWAGLPAGRENLARGRKERAECHMPLMAP
jgi:hypothetical protein